MVNHDFSICYFCMIKWKIAMQFFQPSQIEKSYSKIAVPKINTIYMTKNDQYNVFCTHYAKNAAFFKKKKATGRIILRAIVFENFSGSENLFTFFPLAGKNLRFIIRFYWKLKFSKPPPSVFFFCNHQFHIINNQFGQFPNGTTTT